MSDLGWTFADCTDTSCGALQDALASMIPDEDLYTDDDIKGREDRPHITVFYGFTPKVEAYEVLERLEHEPEIEARVTGIGYFRNEEKPYDVVYLSVESAGLAEANRLLKDLPNENEYLDEYTAHMTIAYVKKGYELPLASKDVSLGCAMTFSKLYFEGPGDDAETFPIPLTGIATPPKKPVVCVDFDGVLHLYSRGWYDGTVYDDPVPGAREGIEALRHKYTVVILSARAGTPEGFSDIQHWLDKHEIEVDAVTAIKPPAKMYLDDHAIPFKGDWEQAIEDIAAHKGWLAQDVAELVEVQERLEESQAQQASWKVYRLSSIHNELPLTWA